MAAGTKPCILAGVGESVCVYYVKIDHDRESKCFPVVNPTFISRLPALRKGAGHSRIAGGAAAFSTRNIRRSRPNAAARASQSSQNSHSAAIFSVSRQKGCRISPHPVCIIREEFSGPKWVVVSALLGCIGVVDDLGRLKGGATPLQTKPNQTRGSLPQSSYRPVALSNGLAVPKLRSMDRALKETFLFAADPNEFPWTLRSLWVPRFRSVKLLAEKKKRKKKKAEVLQG